MAELRLRNGLIALIDERDQTYLSQWAWSWSEELGVVRYDAERYDSQEQRTPHVLLARFLTRAEEGMYVVHVDGERLNNQRANLLLLDHVQFTQYTQKARGRNQYLGVSWKGDMEQWRAQCGHQFLGYFEDEVDAARAYDAAALEMYGPSARLNFRRSFEVCIGCHRAFHVLKAAPYHDAICRARAELRSW